MTVKSNQFSTQRVNFKSSDVLASSMSGGAIAVHTVR